VTHRGHELCIQDELPRALHSIVPSLVVDPQTNEL
jgi:hypothetical protein